MGIEPGADDAAQDWAAIISELNPAGRLASGWEEFGCDEDSLDDIKRDWKTTLGEENHLIIES